MLGVGEDLKNHLIPALPSMDRDTSHWIGLFKVLSNRALSTARIGAALLGNLCLCLTTLTIKIAFS